MTANTGNAGAAPKRRRWPGRLVALSIIPALILGAELALRLVGFGYDTAFFQQVDGAEVYTRNLKYGWRFFPRSMATTPEVFRVPVEKAEGAFRVFVLGGSAALGTPDAAFGVSRVLQAMLDELYPEGRVEVVNTAMAAINSNVVLQIASECAELEPDLFVVYLGNNEVIGPFGAGTIFAGYSASRSSIRAGLWLKSTRLGQLYETFAPERGEFEVWRGMEMFSEHHVPADDPRLERVYAHFRANLEDVCDLARDAGAQVLLCTVGTNLRDNPPFGSRHRKGLAAGDEEAWTDQYGRGVALEEAGEPAGALALYEAAARLDDRFADLHFRTACCLLEAGRTEEAKAEYVRARDLDTLRFRADSRINAILRELGAARADRGVHLVDAERAFETSERTPDGIPGFEHFWEHVHMTFPGNYLLGAAILPRLEAQLPSELRALRQSDVVVPSYARVAERLVFTERDEADHTDTILSMVKRPPFIGQIDYEARRAALARRVRELRATKKEALRTALARYTEAVERHPGDWQLLFNLAGIHMQRGAADEAAEVYGRLVAMFPAEISYRQSLSRALFGMERDDEALAQLDVALDIDPDNPDVNTSLGNYYAKRGDHERALQHYLVALERRPGHLAHTYAGDVLFDEGRYDEARQHFERALLVDPDFAPAMAHLALLLAQEGTAEDLPRALELAERACEVSEYGVLEHVHTLAAVLRESDDVRRIGEVLERATEVAKAEGRGDDVAELRRLSAGIDAELDRKRRARRASTLIRRLGGEMGLPAERVQELAALPLDERLRALDELGRRFVVQRVADQGLPDGLTRAEWESWADLSDSDFFARALEFGLLPGAKAGGG